MTKNAKSCNVRIKTKMGKVKRCHKKARWMNSIKVWICLAHWTQFIKGYAKKRNESIYFGGPLDEQG